MISTPGYAKTCSCCIIFFIVQTQLSIWICCIYGMLVWNIVMLAEAWAINAALPISALPWNVAACKCVSCRSDFLESLTCTECWSGILFIARLLLLPSGLRYSSCWDYCVALLQYEVYAIYLCGCSKPFDVDLLSCSQQKSLIFKDVQFNTFQTNKALS